jgi:hypothetical protein
MSSTMIYVIFMTLCHGELPRICYSSPGEMYLTQDKCDGELDRRWHDYNDIGGEPFFRCEARAASDGPPRKRTYTIPTNYYGYIQ